MIQSMILKLLLLIILKGCNLHNTDKNNVGELDLKTGVQKHDGKLMIENSPISFESDFISVRQSNFPSLQNLF